MSPDCSWRWPRGALAGWVQCGLGGFLAPPFPAGPWLRAQQLARGIPDLYGARAPGGEVGAGVPEGLGEAGVWMQHSFGGAGQGGVLGSGLLLSLPGCVKKSELCARVVGEGVLWTGAWPDLPFPKGGVRELQGPLPAF